MAIEKDTPAGPESVKPTTKRQPAEALPRSEMTPLKRAFPNGTPFMQRVEEYRRKKDAELEAKQAAAAAKATEPAPEDEDVA